MSVDLSATCYIETVRCKLRLTFPVVYLRSYRIMARTRSWGNRGGGRNGGRRGGRAGGRGGGRTGGRGGGEEEQEQQQQQQQQQHPDPAMIAMITQVVNAVLAQREANPTGVRLIEIQR